LGGVRGSMSPVFVTIHMRCEKVGGTILMLLILTTGILGQESGIKGTVFDANGSVIPGVGITISDKNQSTFEVRTDAEGKYRIKLSPGLYAMVIGDDRNSLLSSPSC
jgi:hypothetical protein